MKINKKAFTLGELLVVFAVVTIVTVLMIPFIKHNYYFRERTVCANNMREIGLALYIYAIEHEGKFPPRLKDLYDEQYIADEELMDCPASEEQGTPESPDYIYKAGLTVESNSVDVLLADKSKNHVHGGKNVMYVNGTVLWDENL